MWYSIFSIPIFNHSKRYRCYWFIRVLLLSGRNKYSSFFVRSLQAIFLPGEMEMELRPYVIGTTFRYLFHALFWCKSIYYHHLNYPNDMRIRFVINDEWMNEHKSHERGASVFISCDVFMELLNNNYISKTSLFRRKTKRHTFKSIVVQFQMWILDALGAGNGQNERIDKC